MSNKILNKDKEIGVFFSINNTGMINFDKNFKTYGNINQVFNSDELITTNLLIQNNNNIIESFSNKYNKKYYILILILLLIILILYKIYFKK